MGSQNKHPISVWSQIELEKQIIHLVCYSSVFQDGITVQAISQICGSKPLETDLVIAKLLSAGKIKRSGHFLYCQDLSITTGKKEKDAELIQQVIKRNNLWIRFIRKIPIIKFIGISGSLAANNPLVGKDGRLDMDLFIITSSRSLWIFALFTKLFTGLRLNKFFRNPLCFNYIMDGSFLEVHNQNFYVATEIVNLLPIYGKKMYRRFVDINDWVYYYYPNFVPKTHF